MVRTYNQMATGAFESDYDDSDRSAFVDGCSEDGEVSESVCGCLFDYIRKRVPE